MDVVTITGAWQALKAARELVGGLIDAKVDAEVQSRVIDAQAKLGNVQDTLFSLREELFSLQEQNNDLKQQLAENASWTAQADRYELASTKGGAVVYSFKGEPAHYACPSCFTSKQIHILQSNRTRHGTFNCPGCKSTFPVEIYKPLQIQTHTLR